MGRRLSEQELEQQLQRARIHLWRLEHLKRQRGEPTLAGLWPSQQVGAAMDALRAAVRTGNLDCATLGLAMLERIQVWVRLGEKTLEKGKEQS